MARHRAYGSSPRSSVIVTAVTIRTLPRLLVRTDNRECVLGSRPCGFHHNSDAFSCRSGAGGANWDSVGPSMNQKHWPLPDESAGTAPNDLVTRVRCESL